MSGQRSLALVDANAFYASCERALDPSLEKRPVIVLSNNDGCAIARSKEAKALGIRMGDPWFKIRDLCRREGVAALSSNYALYGDMSRRINEIYRGMAPSVETYSIDESFLDLTGVPVFDGDRTGYGRAIRERVLRWTGIPTCVGIAPTKTLAKLANAIAKDDPALAGVCDLGDPEERGRRLDAVKLESVWGVGAATALGLRRMGLDTAGDLARMDARQARQAFSVVLERTVLELRGVACIPFEEKAPPRQNIAVTRSFGKPVHTLAHMLEAVATHAARGAEKLRQQGLATPRVRVLMETARHGKGLQRAVSGTCVLADPSDDTLDICAAARAAATELWRDGYAYAKAGILLEGLIPREAIPATLFPKRERTGSTNLMAALDAVNGRFGRGSLQLASEGIEKPWKARFGMLSGLGTTDVGVLPLVRAGDGSGWRLFEVAPSPGGHGAAAEPVPTPDAGLWITPPAPECQADLRPSGASAADRDLFSHASRDD